MIAVHSVSLSLFVSLSHSISLSLKHTHTHTHTHTHKLAFTLLCFVATAFGCTQGIGKNPSEVHGNSLPELSEGKKETCPSEVVLQHHSSPISVFSFI